jgi:hypothetical protein
MSSPPRGDFSSSSAGYGNVSPFRGSPFIEEDNPFADLASSRSTPPISGLQASPIAPSRNSSSLSPSPPPSPDSQFTLGAEASSSELFGSSSQTSPPAARSSSSTSQPKPSVSASTTRTSSASRTSPMASRRRPTGSRLAQSMVSKLEDLDLESDPLGPLGESAPDVIAPPPPPAKDDSPAPRVTRQPPTTFAEIKSDIAEPIKRVDSQAQAPPSMARQLSIPLEQAAQPPTFKITVGDPTTIGNLTGSHTEYKVRTKVLLPEIRC